MTGILNALIAGVSGAVKDAYFNLVSLLLPGNGTNGAQNNTFLDGSTNNFTITRNGNTTQGTFSPFSQTGWGNYFDGSGDYLTAPDNTAFNLTSGNFTLEAWVYWLGSGDQKIFSKDGKSGVSYNQYALYVNGSLNATVGSGNNTSYGQFLVDPVAFEKNTWVHVAFVKNGSQLTLYKNGTSVATAAQTGTMVSGGRALYIGYEDSQPSSTAWNGYISNARIVKGTAIYTSNFTPPISPLTAISGTSLLTCQSNRFLDSGTANGGTGFPITVNGNPSVVAFSPFAPTAAYTTAAVGGSGYFDGTGDYLSLSGASLTPSGVNVTIDFWFYPTTTGTNLVLFQAGTDTTGDMQCLFDSSVGLRFQITGTSGSLNTNYQVNAWNYVVCVKSGTSFTVYVNNVAGNTATLTPNNTTSLSIGGRSTGSNMTGYISGFRFTTGAANTPSSIPTSPPTTSVPSGTVAALLNFTNAGITDATAKNDLETVGNAQISTTQSKWGGGSISVSSGNYLTAPSNVLLPFGTGDFTIEFWAYWNGGAFTNYATVIDTRNGSFAGGLAIAANITTGAWYVSIAAQEILSTTAAAASWQHVAVTRQGTSLKLFVNGTQAGLTYTSSDNFSNTTLRVGVRPDNQYPWNGYIDDLRITRGLARYTANFTAPSAPFPVQ